MSAHENNNWLKSKSQVFWGEIAPADHVVQIYEDDGVFLDLLEGFVKGGIKADDCVIVIATLEHLQALEERLRNNGFDVFDLKLRDQYIPMNAGSALTEFMIDGWPDEVLFRYLMTSLMARADARKRKVRAFGEMVAVLWSHGHTAATVQLEEMWNKVCEAGAVSLFCAYPRSGFNEDAQKAIMNTNGSHSRMVTGIGTSKTEIYFKSLDSNKQAG